MEQIGSADPLSSLLRMSYYMLYNMLSECCVEYKLIQLYQKSFVWCFAFSRTSTFELISPVTNGFTRSLGNSTRMCSGMNPVCTRAYSIPSQSQRIFIPEDSKNTKSRRNPRSLDKSRSYWTVELLEGQTRQWPVLWFVS